MCIGVPPADYSGSWSRKWKVTINRYYRWQSLYAWNRHIPERVIIQPRVIPPLVLPDPPRSDRWLNLNLSWPNKPRSIIRSENEQWKMSLSSEITRYLDSVLPDFSFTDRHSANLTQLPAVCTLGRVYIPNRFSIDRDRPLLRSTIDDRIFIEIKEQQFVNIRSKRKKRRWILIYFAA